MEKAFDAIVVGAGATGGWAAKELTEAGFDVLLLEAGPTASFGEGPPAGLSIDPSRQATQARCYAFEEATAHLFVDDVDCPYTHPEGKPFEWIRGRQVGGRLHTWGGTCLRMSDYELKAASRDGVGEDWPIAYADLAPYYDRVERFMRVRGDADGVPQLPDGDGFTAPARLSASERAFAASVERRWPTRRVIGSRVAEAPGDAMVRAALASGRLTLRTDSVASRVTTAGGRARGVAFVDRHDGEEREARARAIVLCASAIESTRLLLNSATAEHPDGLANSSGVLGHYLMDHTYGIGLDGSFSHPPRPDAEKTLHGCVIPCFRNIGETDVDFIRGYGVELQIHTPLAGPLGRWWGRGRPRPGRFWMRVFGEVLPRFENRVSIDPDRTDSLGIPVARIECEYGENEARMATDQLRCLREMAAAAGLRVEREHTELAPPGLSVHEMGTARMGSDPSTSVLNRWNQCWDVENLFLTDAACFTSGGCQNPTLTMMALTARACEHVAGRLARREL